MVNARDNETDILNARDDLFNKECNYYDIDDFAGVSMVDNEYRLMHLNVQGLHSKFDNLKLMLHRMDESGKK